MSDMNDFDDKIDHAMLWILRSISAVILALALFLGAAVFGLGPMADECPAEVTQ